jgi:hypothetical protein
MRLSSGVPGVSVRSTTGDPPSLAEIRPAKRRRGVEKSSGAEREAPFGGKDLKSKT